jgi:hypothetical protein
MLGCPPVNSAIRDRVRSLGVPFQYQAPVLTRELPWYNAFIVSSEEVREMAKLVRIVRISKDEAIRRLGDAPDDKRFWANDGRTIKNLKELGMSLSEMNAGTYQYHREGGRNDFSKWVRDVVGDAQLADELAKADSSEQASRAVAQRISLLESRI